MSENRTIWCGNLSDKVTEEILYELFLQAAPLERVKIPVATDGRKFNYAFITFKHEVSIDYAIQLLSGIRLYGKNLNIQRRNSNSQNNERNTDRSDYKHPNQTPLTGDLLRPNFNENRQGRLERGNYQEREDRYRDYRKNDNRNSYHDNRNDSPNRRRHNNEQWNGRRNRHY